MCWELTFIPLPVILKKRLVMDEHILKALNEQEKDCIFSQYSYNKAVDAAKYVIGISNEKPDMTMTDGVEEFNNWYSEQNKESIEEREWEERAEEVFNENRTKVSFSDVEGTSDIINNDCNEKTHGMIPEITKPTDFVDYEQRGLVGAILNTIYLKEKWYDKREKIEKFVFSGEEVEGMKSVETELACLKWYNAGCLVSMRLKNGFKFHAYMPKDISIGLSEKDYSFISNYVKKEHEFAKAKVEMPAIVTDSEMDCVIDGLDKCLYVRQKAKIDCTYEGVEAAAATLVLCLSGCTAYHEEKKILEIVLDKPFFFFIEKEGKIFFVGKKVGSYLVKERKTRETAEALGFYK